MQAVTVSLPVELLDVIFSHLEAGEDVDRQKTRNLNLWYDLCLVNHNFYTAAAPRLYRKFTYRGALEQRRRPWQFLRTIVEVPDLAQHVRVVDLQHFLRNTGVTTGSFALARLLTAEYSRTVEQTVSYAGLSDLGLDVIRTALSNDDRKPLVALILACLPNLRELEMHVAHHDPCLEAILFYAAGLTPRYVSAGMHPQGPILQHLERLFVASNGQPVEHPLPPQSYFLQLDRYRPFWHLPCLQELLLEGCQIARDMLYWTRSPWEYPVGPCLSTLAIVVCDVDNGSSTSYAGEFVHLLDLLPPLKGFSLELDTPPNAPWTMGHTMAVWDRLSSTSRDTLEHPCLRSRRVVDVGNHSSSDIVQQKSPWCPPFSRFQKLRSLVISVDDLLGNCQTRHHHHGPACYYQLSQHLPAGLSDLTLCGPFFRSSSSMPTVDLPAKLERIVPTSEYRPERIQIEGVGKRSLSPLPCDQLARACWARGISFKVARDYYPRYWNRRIQFRRSSWRHFIPFDQRMIPVLLEIQSVVPKAM